MNKLKSTIRDYKFWIGVSAASLLLNMGLGAAAVHYHNKATEEFNSLTVYWHKSNTASSPNISYPNVCYEKEIVVNGKEK